jgi:predicted Zn-dependent peptidase
MEHMAFGANANFKDEQAYEAEFTKNGAYHNAWTSDFSICYEAECADFEWERILALQRMAIDKPRFNESELKSEKGNVRSELTGYQNDYSRLLWPRLQKEIGEDVLEYSERLKTLNNIELKDIREHHRRTHTASNMRFIITGEIGRRKKQIISMLEQWELGMGERFEIIRDELRACDPIMIRRKDASNLTFGFSWITPRKLEEREMFAMGCLNHILNGTMTSKIFGQARKRGLIYGMGSSTGSNIHNSAWDFDGEVNVESARELFALIATELTKVLNGKMKDEDIEAAKSYALGRHQMGAQTVNQISDYYADTFFSVEEIGSYDKAPDLIRGIEKAEMVELAREFAGSGISAVAGVGNIEKSMLLELCDTLKV